MLELSRVSTPRNRSWTNLFWLRRETTDLCIYQIWHRFEGYTDSKATEKKARRLVGSQLAVPAAGLPKEGQGHFPVSILLKPKLRGARAALPSWHLLAY